MFGKEINIIHSSRPVGASTTLDYFEVTIENEGKTGEIAIGLASTDVAIDKNKMPGLASQTIGYHTDGTIYPDVKNSTSLDLFGTGDTIGCKITRIEVGLARFQRVQFTKNGTKFDVARYFDAGEYYPTIGIKSEGAILIVNTGHEKFSYVPDGTYS